MADTVTTAHTEGISMAQDGRFRKMKLIGLNTAKEDVVAEDAVHIMALPLE